MTWQDVGIDNGLHRVVQNLQAVRAADVVIVVSGMDGSLPSVIAGLVDSPVVRPGKTLDMGLLCGDYNRTLRCCMCREEMLGPLLLAACCSLLCKH